MRHNSIFTDEQTQYIIDNAKKMDNIDMAKSMNDIFGTNFTAEQINSRRKYIKKRLGIDVKCPKELNKSLIKKGNIPFNKGLTWDDYMDKDTQKLCRNNLDRVNALPIGTEKVKVKVKNRGYVYVKTGKDKWQPKSKLVWEEANGPIPEDKVILFLDGNPENVCLENMTLISRQENLYLNKHKLQSNNVEITKTCINIARVATTAFEKRRKK